MSKRQYQQFFICKHCHNLVGMINNAGVQIICCGEAMSELVPNTVDASAEKHVPFVTVNDDLVNVQIGSLSHPMGEEHSIGWIYLETENGGQRKNLETDGAPSAVFTLTDDKPVAVYAYCYLHGLWKKDLE